MEEAAFELALADVPCSGTGTLGRNPEIRHRFGVPRTSLARPNAQRRFCRPPCAPVHPGGCVVYSTCSAGTEENEQTVTQVLTEKPECPPDFARRAHRSPARRGHSHPHRRGAAARSLTPDGCLRLLPEDSTPTAFSSLWWSELPDRRGNPTPSLILFPVPCFAHFATVSTTSALWSTRAPAGGCSASTAPGLTGGVGAASRCHRRHRHIHKYCRGLDAHPGQIRLRADHRQAGQVGHDKAISRRVVRSGHQQV